MLGTLHLGRRAACTDHTGSMKEDEVGGRGRTIAAGFAARRDLNTILTRDVIEYICVTVQSLSLRVTACVL